MKGKKKIIIYTNVIEDSNGYSQFPFGIAQFQAFLQNTVLSTHKYRHGINKIGQGDIMIWAFRDDEKEKGCWYLLGDCFVTDKVKQEGDKWWTFTVYGGRLYPRMVKLDDLSFANAVIKLIHVLGPDLTWEQYQEVIEKVSEPIQ